MFIKADSHASSVRYCYSKPVLGIVAVVIKRAPYHWLVKDYKTHSWLRDFRLCRDAKLWLIDNL